MARKGKGNDLVGLEISRKVREWGAWYFGEEGRDLLEDINEVPWVKESKGERTEAETMLRISKSLGSQKEGFEGTVCLKQEDLEWLKGYLEENGKCLVEENSGKEGHPACETCLNNGAEMLELLKELEASDRGYKCPRCGGELLAWLGEKGSTLYRINRKTGRPVKRVEKELLRKKGFATRRWLERFYCERCDKFFDPEDKDILVFDEYLGEELAV